MFNSFMTKAPCYVENSPLICSANLWTGFCMIVASAMKELNNPQTLKGLLQGF